MNGLASLCIGLHMAGMDLVAGAALSFVAAGTAGLQAVAGRRIRLR